MAIFTSRYMKIFLVILSCVTIALISTVSGSIFAFGRLTDTEEIEEVLDDFFYQRCAALLSGNYSYIDSQFDKSSRYGKWSYEHEQKRIRYLKEWSAARGIILRECESKLYIFSIKPWKGVVKTYLSERTRITYTYQNQDPEIVNELCLGTKHTINLINKNGIWNITVDWYSDPLEDSMPENLPTSTAQVSQESGTYTWVKYDRVKAVQYADKYCGANFNIDDGYKYNKKYKNFADLGGDCANFASQILTDKEAGGMKMGGGWLYKNGQASASWVNAGAFTKSLLYSGRAKLISKGKYDKVLNFTKYLSPGDVVAYERKGDIVHVSIVTAKDSMGTLLVDSHTNDRYHVPWDLGWNGGNINFWLLKING